VRFAAETLRFRHRVGAVLLDRIARARSGVEIFLLELVRLRAVERRQAHARFGACERVAHWGGR